MLHERADESVAAERQGDDREEPHDEGKARRHDVVVDRYVSEHRLGQANERRVSIDSKG